MAQTSEMEKHAGVELGIATTNLPSLVFSRSSTRRLEQPVNNNKCTGFSAVHTAWRVKIAEFISQSRLHDPDLLYLFPLPLDSGAKLEDL